MSTEINVCLKKIRVSPQKLNVVAKMIRGMKADKAVGTLMCCKKRIAADVYKCVRSAMASAENNYGISSDRLRVKESSVGYGMKMRRYEPRGRGRSGRICKPFSQLRIVMEEV